eukprot:TRINITY_DN14167_c0_g1_i3.p1 TRINITY_DN14167_c0_g1~~TRINITY_DN14167_c0_g1_i3.p1  ORF type:complete len:489 (+),score=169.85 TRINITY_DN14167_c0_g1_i3:64-1467(+)
MSDAAALTALLQRLEVVLSAFESIKIASFDSFSGSSASDEYFPKFLTSRKLLHLQLRDPEFRLNILVQALIVFHYLTTPNVKKRVFSLNPLQLEKINVLQERIFNVIASTHNGGASFANELRFLLKRETYWSVWKDEGCPSLLPPAATTTTTTAEPSRKSALEEKSEAGPEAKKPRVGKGPATKAKSKPQMTMMGSVELARLWQLGDGKDTFSEHVNPAAMLQFLQQRKQKTMGFEDILEKVREEEDPENAFEEEYKSKNDPRYVFQALRVMAMADFEVFENANGNLKNALDFYEKERLKKKRGNVPSSSASAASSASATAAPNSGSAPQDESSTTEEEPNNSISASMDKETEDSRTEGHTEEQEEAHKPDDDAEEEHESFQVKAERKDDDEEPEQRFKPVKQEFQESEKSVKLEQIDEELEEATAEGEAVAEGEEELEREAELAELEEELLEEEQRSADAEMNDAE